jgi:hypothetical protein
MNQAYKSGLLVLLGGLTVLLSNSVADRLANAKMSCHARMAVLADEIKPLAIIPVKDTEEQAIVAMMGQQKSILVTLTLTEGNALFERQCTRPDGKRVLMSIEENPFGK